MASTYPTTIDNFTNPTTTDKVAVISHALQHSNANDAIEALEAKVGANSSAVTTSHDYKLGEVVSTDKAVGKSATQTLSNKTLTTPKIVTGGSITDENGNKQIEFVTTASAVNDVKITNSATGNAPAVESAGSDSNIDLTVKGKGTGKVKLGTAGLKFPNADGSANQVIKTDGAGQLGWASPSAGVSTTTMLPKSSLGVTSYTNIGHSTNTELYFGMIDVTESMTIAKVTFWVNSYTASGTTKFALYSQDGQTKHFEFTSATVSSGGQQITTTLGTPYAITPGKYYLATCSVGSSNYEIFTQDPSSALHSNMNFTTGEYYYTGIKTITAGTIPSTIDPTASVTSSRFGTAVVRFEN